MGERGTKIIRVLLLALLLGIPGFGMALGDLGEGRTILDWIVLSAAYFLFAGFLLGVNERNYWYLSLVAVWGPLLVSMAIVFFQIGRQPFMILTILVPVIFVLLGSFLGSKIWGRLSTD